MLLHDGRNVQVRGLKPIVGIAALVALCCRAWAAAPEVTGDELVANGSFESDVTTEGRLLPQGPGADDPLNRIPVRTERNNLI